MRGSDLDDVQGAWLTRLRGANAYLAWIMAEVAPYVGRDVLEVGCGNGNFTLLLGEIAGRVTALDIDAELVALARQRIAGHAHLTALALDVMALEPQSRFDTVVMLDVLEHIEDDVAVLGKLRRHLHPGGALVIKVPAIPALYNGMDQAIGHYRRYDRQRLAAALREAGFDEVRVWGFNLLGVLGWWLNGTVLGRKIPPSDHIEGFDRLVPVLRRLERLARPGTGLSLFASARAG